MNNYITSITYSKFELLICLHFPMVATGINKGVYHFDVPFKCQFGALMCSLSSLCLLMMGSDCMGALGEGSNFQLEGLKIEF